jgi:hypothetical protein
MKLVDIYGTLSHIKSVKVIYLSVMLYVLTKASSNMRIDAVSQRRPSYGSAIFYPAMLENEENNIVKLPLHDQNNVRFGP